MRAAFLLLVLFLDATSLSAQVSGLDHPPDPPLRDARPPAAIGTASIQGRVVAVGGAFPVRGAHVQLIGQKLAENRSTITDENGRYQFNTLPAGTYRLSASKTGLIIGMYGQRRPLGSWKPIDLSEGERAAPADIGLVRGGVISGRIADIYGDPIAGANVQAFRFGYIDGEQRASAGTAGVMTSDSGEFRFWGLTPGEYVVVAFQRDVTPPPGSTDDSRAAYAPTFYPAARTAATAERLTVAGGSTIGDVNFALTLAPTATVSGSVVSEDGRPVTTGVANIIPGDRSAVMGLNYGQARLAADGTFSISHVLPGDYVVKVDGPPARGQNGLPGLTLGADVLVSGSDIQGLQLTPMLPATVRGRVIMDSQSAAILATKTFRIGARPRGTMGTPGPTPVINEDGTFELKAAPGAISIELLAGGTVPPWRLMSVRVDSVEKMNTGIDLRRGDIVDDVEIAISAHLPLVSGLVRERNGSVAGHVTVIAFPQDASTWTAPVAGWVGVADTDREGRFRLQALRPGAYYITAVDDVLQGEWDNPGYLETLRRHAVRATFRSGATNEVNLTLTADR